MLDKVLEEQLEVTGEDVEGAGADVSTHTKK